MNAIFNDSETAPRFERVTDKQFELGNIQRRIYDVVNVLVALGYIEKLPNKMIACKRSDPAQDFSLGKDPDDPNGHQQLLLKRQKLECTRSCVCSGLTLN